jgi:hypothetical protein
LKAGAERSGQSLQQYVRGRLVEAAQRLQIEFLFAEFLTAHGVVDAAAAVDSVRAERITNPRTTRGTSLWPSE